MKPRALDARPLRSEPMPGRHGGDVHFVARQLGVDPSTLLDLSASLNPLAPNVGALAVKHLGSMHRYPDDRDATRMLAEALGAPEDQLLLTNGGAEGISLLSAEIGGQVVEPEFSLHPRGDASRPRWRSNPHNPTGRLAGPDDRADVWDEAFYPLATGSWTRGDLAAGSTAVVGSLTKTFACPGLRLGYIVAAPDLIERARRRRPEWSVGSLALALLPELLQRAELATWAAGIAALRNDLTDLLRRRGLEPEPSDANFLLCPAPPAFRARLLSHGIVVRDCSSFGLPDTVRLAVPGPAGLVRLDAALEVIL